MSNRSGFSLIELIVVVGLLGLLASGVFIAIGGLVPAFEIESAARKLGSSISNLRAQAVLTGKPHAILFDLEAGTYTYLVPPEIEEDGGPPLPVNEDDLEELSPVKLGSGIIFEDVAFGGRKVHRGKVKIMFSALEPAPPHLLHIKGGDELQYTVEVNTVTGIVEVSEGYQEFEILLTEEKFRRR